MKTTIILILAVAASALLCACDSESVPAAPEQYEQAKDDCEPHGGLADVKKVYVLFRQDRVDAVCKSGVRVSRDA